MIFRSLAVAALMVVAAGAAHAEETHAGQIAVADAWARASAGSTTATGAFLTVRNDGDAPDKLVSAASPAAEKVELHTTIVDGDVMRMRPVDSIEVPPHGSVALKPGSYHVMLIGLKKPLDAGDKVPMTLVFQNAGSVHIDVPVQKLGAMKPMGGAAMPMDEKPKQ